MPELNAYYITTTDNPFDPCTQYNEWLYYDEAVLGYYTKNYLARIALTFPEMTVSEYWAEQNRAIDEIIRINGSDIYKKITVPLKS